VREGGKGRDARRKIDVRRRRSHFPVSARHEC
jgi:hypothetical protein